MLVFPNAKINIGLYITGKRTDGYHDLETVFYPVDYKDVLEIIPAKNGQTTLHISGNPVAGNTEDNLVWKAWNLLQRDYPDQVFPIAIYLYKNISTGAGLGGGSADAAFMLRMVNDYFQLDLDTEKLSAYALQLGSDCPFFIRNKACFASGRGEILQPLSLDLSAYRIELLTPGIHCSTALAFKQITPKPAAYPLRDIAALPVEAWKNHISNDFELPVFAQYPELKKLKEQLYEQGALYASLSGSGSALFGIFES